MKQELAAIELRYLVDEFQALVDSRIDKIYQPEKDELLFQLYQRGQGKRVLRVLPGRFIYLTTNKSESPQKPFGYCLFLRKHLNGARLLSISQAGFERIVKIIFDTKRGDIIKKYHLYIELFGKGNAILCDEKDIILSPLETQVWKDRVVRAKEHYLFPKRGTDPKTIDEHGLASALQASGADIIVKALALDLGLGGTYAEEACLLADIDKGGKPASIASQPKQVRQLFAAIKGLCDHTLAPCVVRKEGEVVDIVPFPLRRYHDLETTASDTYNAAMDAVLTGKTISEKKEAKQKTASTAATKQQAIIDAQSKQLERMRQEAEASQRAGEMIYEHYHLVEEILREIRKAREKYSWKDIREKLKGHKMVKDVNEKEGTVTIEL